LTNLYIIDSQLVFEGGFILNKIKLKNFIILLIVAVFLFSSSSPVIIGISKDNLQKNTNITNDFEKEDSISLTCQTFGLCENSKKEVELSKGEIDLFFKKINNLALGIASNTNSLYIEQLQEEILLLAKQYSLLPTDICLNDIKPYFASESNTINPKLGVLPVMGNRGTASFCNFATTGSGMQFPIIIFPRLIPILMTPIPRAFLHWNANDGYTSCGGLLTGKGFIADGMQQGTALGFWGIGFSVFLPPVMAYGFFGYSLFTTCTAENIEPWPPNRPPIISDEEPSDDEWDVSVSLSELSFRIKDPDGDSMDYEVTTDPDVGSGSGKNKKNGFYSIPINNLENDKKYSWTIEVTDGLETVIQQFNFVTEAQPPFNPFNEGWSYRKKITLDDTKINGNHLHFPVLVSVKDSDLKEKAQDDGDDILFMDGSGIATKLYHEIEQYDGFSGELVAWVNIPIIYDEGETFFYIYYGNPTCDNQQVPEKVWFPDYRAVWHLNKDPSEEVLDSTIHKNKGISYGVMNSGNLKEGKIGKSVMFDGIDDYISVSDSDSLKPSSVTLQAFFKPIEDSPDNGFIISKACYDIWGNADGKTYGIRWWGENNISARFERDDRPQAEILGPYPISINSWYYVSCTFDEDSSSGSFYVDGVKRDSGTGFHPTVLWYNSPWDFIMGGSRQHEGGSKEINHWFNCYLDEIRINGLSFSSDRISTEFNNYDDPSGFLSLGPEEVEL